jgi:dTDP-4-dehydrorhamnose reductase
MKDHSSMPIIMLTGANGQLGWELQRRAREAGWHTHALKRQALDISDRDAVRSIVHTLRPDIIINAAAYTGVDRAEAEPDLAYTVNRDGVANMARAARACGGRLVHISTDFVFDGAQGSPYEIDDAPNPQGVYGASKLAGEACVREILGREALIIRTAWVYSAHGSNFVKTMLQLMRERDELRVVDDQIGSPTWARGLADCIWRALDRRLAGTYHWTDAGAASWYDFATAIQEEAFSLGLLGKSVAISPIPASEYPTAAKRPSYSVLSKWGSWQALNYTAAHWRASLRLMLGELARA